MDAFPNHPQLRLARGYSHAFLLNGKNPAAILRDPKTGRSLALATDFPMLMLYAGGFLGAGTMLRGQKAAKPSCAIALEPQEMPAIRPNHQAS